MHHRWPPNTLAEIEPVIRQFVEQFPSFAWKWTLPSIYSQQGLTAQARTSFDSLAANDFDDLPSVDGPSVWLGAVAMLAEACADLGHRQRAALLYDLLAPYARQWVVFQYGFACMGSVRRYLGRLAATMERWKEATEHFEAALEQHTAMATPCELARTQHDFAGMLCTRGRDRDRRAALRLFEQALATARELHLVPLTQDAGRLRALRE